MIFSSLIIRKLITEGLFVSIRKLESYTMLNVHSEVANTIDTAEKIGIQVDWVKGGVGEIIANKSAMHWHERPES